MSRFIEKQATRLFIVDDAFKEHVIWAEEALNELKKLRPDGECTVREFIEKSSYDRMKLALEKALEQRDDYASFVDNVKLRLPGLQECDDKIQKILEGEK